MAKLKVFNSREEIPEVLKDYYIEKEGKFYPDLEGVRTQEDVDRVKAALDKERDDHKETKQSLAKYKDVDLDKWEKIKDLDPTAPPADPGDEKEITRRISEAVREKERELQEQFRKREEELQTEKTALQEKFKENTLRQWRRNTLAEKFGFSNLDDLDTFLLKIDHSELSEYSDLRRALGSIEVQDDNGRFRIVGGEYKDEKGALEVLERVAKAEVAKSFRPAADTSGGGAGNKGGGGGGGENPYKKETWNLTEQGRLEREAPEEAKRLAAAAGITL